MSDFATPLGRERWLYAALAAFVIVLWLAILPGRPLFNPDEGRYAEIPREMLASGDFVIPHLNGLAYIEKPPLQYWASALSLKVFGVTPFAARLYTALSALLTVAVIGGVAARLWGTAAGWRAAGALCGMLLFVILGQLLTLDMSLTLYTTVGLSGFLLAQRAAAAPGARDGGSRGGGSHGPMLVAWGAIALGVLTKGLVAAAIPAAVLVFYSLLARDLTPWRRLHLGTGLPLFVGVTVPWHWLAARRLPDFLEFFFVHEHFARYLTPSADREEPWWFFGAVFLLGTVPWTLSALRVVATGWRRSAAAGTFDGRLFLWVWVVFVCLFFSVSDSKLIPYILPALPAVALSIAALPPAVLRRDLILAAVLTVLTAVALGLVSHYAPRLLPPSDRRPYFLALAGPLLEIAALLLVSGLCALTQGGRQATRAVMFLGVGWCVAGLLLMRAAAAVAPIYSGALLAPALAGIPPGAPLFSVGTYDQSLPFNLQRTVTLVAYGGELSYGLLHAAAPALTSVDQFVARWTGLATGYAVMETSMFDELRQRGLPMRELGRDVHRVAVARP